MSAKHNIWRPCQDRSDKIGMATQNEQRRSSRERKPPQRYGWERTELLERLREAKEKREQAEAELGETSQEKKLSEMLLCLEMEEDDCDLLRGIPAIDERQTRTTSTPEEESAEDYLRSFLHEPDSCTSPPARIVAVEEMEMQHVEKARKFAEEASTRSEQLQREEKIEVRREKAVSSETSWLKVLRRELGLREAA